MKEKLHKDLWEKAVVLGITLVFVFSAFLPAVTSQVGSITASQSLEEPEKIKIGAEESIYNNGVDNNIEDINSIDKTIISNPRHSENDASKNRDDVVSDTGDDSMGSESDVSKIRDGSLWDRFIQMMTRIKDIVDNNRIINRLRELFNRRDMSDDADDVDHDENQMGDDQLNNEKQTNTLNPRLDQSRDSLDPALLDASDPWWNTGWSYRKEITIDNSKVTATLSNFPVLISLSGDPNLASIAQSSGDDIVFTNQTGTVVLAHEIDYYNSGTLQAWVNVTSLFSSVDTVLYMYFGNATCPNQENPSGVWDDGFVMVQHMQEISGTHYDSTSNNNDATEYITPDSNMDTSGKIAGADYFDTGADDYLEVSGDLVTGDGNTVSFWEYNMTRLGVASQYGGVYDDWSGSTGLLWQFGEDTKYQVGNVGDWSNNLVYTHGGLVDDMWHYYTVTLSGGTIILYEDGSPVSSKSHNTNVAADTDNVQIMRRSDGHYTEGKMDELQISNTARSADWIQTSYNNQYDPDSFFDVGPLEPPLPWWNSEWQYRRKITIDNTKVAGDLTDFPTLISLTGDIDLATNAQSNGEDIVFVDGTGLKLDHEIEYYNAGDLDCWVEIPSIFGSSDTVLYMYYGNGTCPNQENPSGVWDSSFVMVQHMQETSGTHYDSTSNNNDATEYITPDSNMDTSGIIAGSDWFDGSDDYLEVSGDLVTGDGNTVSFWEYNITIGTGYGRIFSDFSSGGFLWQFGDNPTDFQVGNVGDWSNNLVYTHGGLVDDIWHYYVLTMDGDYTTLYEDGVKVATDDIHLTTVAVDGAPVRIMGESGQKTTGKMDELRVSNVNRSAEWVETCYMNQYDPDSFFDIGTQEMIDAGVPPVITEQTPADDAVGVSVSLTSLSFKLNDTDGNLMNYTVVTVPNIGTGFANDIGNNTYTVTVSGLSPFTNYVWYVNVSDGNYDVNESYSFTTETLSVFDPSIYGWVYQKKITIDHNMVSDTLTNFPVLIDVTDPDLSSHAQTDGDDIVFMDACGNANLLAHEIEYFDSGSGHLVAWVKVPILSSTVDTEMYMYYGNPASSNVEDKTGVWSNGYEMVTHHNEASGLVYDSTSNGYTGSKVGGVTQNVAGKFAGGDHFDGTSSYLSFGDACDITSGGATWSLWVNHDSKKAQRYFGKGAGGILVQWFWTIGPPEQAHIEVGNVGDWGNQATFVTPQDSGNWHYLTYVFDDSDNKYKIYLDGTFCIMGPASSLPVDNTDSFVVGSGYTHESYAFTNGIIDEARVSSSARNASWITTCYNNQYSPSGFYSMSDELAAGTPDVSDPDPADGATGVSLSITHLEFTINDCQGDSMTYNVDTVPNVGGGGSGGTVSDGTYTVPVSGLAPFTSYVWYVNVSDGTNYNNVSYTFSTQAAASFDPSLYGWQYQRQLIVDSSLVDDDLTDYPLLVSMVDADLGAHARSDGQDIIFMDDCGSASLLDYEIETFDHTTGELVAWVRIPVLSSSVDTELFMFYGKSDAPPLENPSDVWDSNYLVVQHLEETSGVHYDSTSNGYDGTKAGGVTQGASGKINPGDHLDGTGYVSFGDVCDITSGGATWSCWIKLDVEGIHRIVGKGSTGLLIQWYKDVSHCQLQAGYVGVASANWTENVAVSVPQDTEWHQLTTVFNDTSSKYEIFFDGVHMNTGPEADLPVDNGDSFVLGSGYTHDSPMTGFVDEFRVSDIGRSPVWIATCYANQDDPGVFVRIGGEAPAGAPVISNMDPMDGATAVSATITELSFTLTDCQGDTITYTVETVPNIGTGGATVTDGNYNVGVSGLTYETTYTWFVNVTDGTNWNNETFIFTTRPMILLSNPSPPDDGVWALYNPMLEVEVDHDAANPLTIKFLTNASGSWEEIYSYTNCGGGMYSTRAVGMLEREKTFYWRVNVTDNIGNFTEETYDFYMVHFVGDAITPVARSFCCKFGYIGRARETGVAYVTTQQADHVGPGWTPDDIPHYAKYDINQGWVETYEFLFNTGYAFHNFWGYWNDEYHAIGGQGSSGCQVADSPTWAGFQSMDFRDEFYSVGPRTDTNPTPSCYSFDNDNAWIISSDEGYHVMKYWPWNSTTGWGSPVSIEATRTSLNLDAGQILQINKTTWLLYYAQPSGADILYVKTTDASQTWSGPFDPSIPTTTSSCNRVSFAQYGENYYMFVTEGGGQAVIYNSTDGENWSNRQVLFTGHIVHHGCLLHQGALISTHAGTGDPGDQYGILTVISEMICDPEEPTDEYPSHETVFDLGTTSTSLSVTAHGDQVYDVAFYWENGTYIGEDRILEEGDIASIKLNGLEDNKAYKWYAVCRGYTGLYAGNEPLSTSDENKSDVFRFSIGVSAAPKVMYENPANDSVNIPVSLSQLSFDLEDDQGDSMTYTVETKPNIGSDGTTVGNGSYSISVCCLDYATQYYWWVNVTDGVHPVSMEYRFTTELETTFDPFTHGWGYRKEIVIDHTKVMEDLTNFPVLVDISDSDLASHAQADGDDILFMDDSGIANRLNHEIEYYNTGDLAAWVNVTSLSSSTDTILYMYYGNATCSSQENIAGVWDSHYHLVQHLNETSGTHYDTTTYTNDGTPIGGVTQNAVGMIDGGDSFDGVDGLVTVADADSLTFGDGSSDGPFTVSTWVYMDTSTVKQRFVCKADSLSDGEYILSTTGGSLLTFSVIDQSEGAVIGRTYSVVPSLGRWYHLAGTYDGSGSMWKSGIKLYLDGKRIDDGDLSGGGTYTAMENSAKPLYIGKYGSNYLDGMVDEVRISNPVRSQGWINASYMNQKAPSEFYSLGSEESGEPPVVSNPIPGDGDTGVSVSLTDLSITLIDYQGDSMTYTVETVPNIGIGGATVGDGTYFVSVSGLVYNTLYTWYVNVTDGAEWTRETYTFTTESAPINNPTVFSNENPMDTATDVSTSLSELSILIEDPEGDTFDWSIECVNGDSNSGTGNNGTKTCTINSPLSYSTTYTWYVNSTDSAGSGQWTRETYTFISELEPAGWWNSEWPYRKQITIDHNMVMEDLYNFPVLIKTTADSDLTLHAQTDADDLVFTDYYGSVLNHEIEYYNTGDLVAWVNVTSLSSTTDTVLYLYYGNATCSSQENTLGVWDSHYHLVHHLDETSGTHYDSTSYANDGTPSGGVNQNTVGMIDGGDSFDGVNGFVSIADDNSLSFGDGSSDGPFTISAWVYIDSDTTRQRFVGKADALNDAEYLLSTSGAGGGQFALYLYDQSTSAFIGRIYNTPPNPGQWYHLAGTYDGSGSMSGIKLYLDGVRVDDADSSKDDYTAMENSAKPLYIGKYGSTYLDGMIDEVRISNPVRNHGWINTSYLNQKSPDDFYDVGLEEINVLPDNYVILNSPLDETFSEWTIDFTFTPMFIDPIVNASLYTNESGTLEKVETIYSVTADTTNIITHTFSHTYPYPEEGTYEWNIEVWNSTQGVFSTSSSTVTIDIPPRHRNAGSNTTTPKEGDPVELFAQGYDGIGLESAWLATDESGEWVNYTTLIPIGHGNGTIEWSGGCGTTQRGILYDGIMYDTECGALYLRNWSTMAVLDTHPIGGYTNTAPCLDLTNEEIVYVSCSSNGRIIGYNTTSKSEIWSRTFHISESGPRDIDARCMYLDEGYLFVILCNFTIYKLDKTDGTTAGIFYLEYGDVGNKGTRMFSVDSEENRIYGVGYSTFHCINSTDMTEIWNAPLPAGSGSEGNSVPLIVKDDGLYRIYFGTTLDPWDGTDNRGYVHCFDYDGNEIWNTSIDGGVHSHMAYNPLTEYIYTNDFFDYDGSMTNRIYALNRSTGIEIWNITGPRGDHFVRRVEFVGNIGLFHTDNGYGHGGGEYLYLFNAEDGTFFGEIPYTGQSLCNIIISEGKVVIGGVNGIIRFDLGIGEYLDYKYLYGNDRIGYTDAKALTCYGSSFTYETKYYDLGGVADAWTWSNFSWRNGSITAGTTVNWRIYYNDSNGNINKTDIQSFTVIGPTEPIIYDPNPANNSVDIPISTSTLSVTIEDPQGDTFDWSIECSNGDSNSGTGDNGTKTCTITSPLSYSTTYTWYVNATDIGTGYSTNKTYTFTTEIEPAGWWNTEWPYRKEITIDYNMVMEDLYDFPLLIEISDGDLALHAQPDADDLVFTEYYGVQLNHEIEYYTAGDLVAWVNVTELSSSTDTVLYMYYGNATCSSQENITGVWDSHYHLVQHLNETSGTHYDTTTYTNDGTPIGGVTQNAVGMIDGGDSFDGVDGLVTVADADSLTFGDGSSDGPFTVSAWVYIDSDTTRQRFVGKADSMSDGEYLLTTSGAGGGQFALYLYDQSASAYIGRIYSTPPNPSQWYHLVGTYDGSGSMSGIKLYLDGVRVDDADSSNGGYVAMENSGKPLYIGKYGSTYLDGMVDEVRISNPVRSHGWINASYLNQREPNMFYNVGDEETPPSEDIIPPEITDIAVTMSDPIDTDPTYGWENITCTVTDNVGAHSVFVNITFPDLHTETLPMINGGGGQYYYNTTYTAVGSYSYHIWANDTSDNSNTSSVDTFEMPPNWDINMDGVCNIIDVSRCSVEWMDSSSNNGWIREDINNDGVVNIIDVSQLSIHWMDEW